VYIAAPKKAAGPSAIEANVNKPIKKQGLAVPPFNDSICLKFNFFVFIISNLRIDTNACPRV
jgi:hypothetical protein